MTTCVTNKTQTAKRHKILGVDFNLVGYEYVMKTINHWCQLSEKRCITITNPHSVLMCHRNEHMRQATAKASLTLPDGIGIILAAKLLRYKNSGRVTGPALMLKLCDWGRRYGFRHYFYGGQTGVAEKLSERLSENYPGLQIAGTYCPPFESVSQIQDEKIVEEINQTKPDIVWVGLGAPKQEIWMAEHLGRVDAAAMIGVGAAFDFHSGNIKWTPAWIRKIGLEWAYRFAQEPERLWRRNLDSPIFLAMVLWQRIAMILDHPAS